MKALVGDVTRTPKSLYHFSKKGAWGHRFKIGHKITFGYGLAIGVAAFGILSGQILGETLWEAPALERRNQEQKEAAVLIELKDAILESQSDIIPFLRQPDLLTTYYYHLLNRADQVQVLFERFETMLDPSMDLDTEGHHQSTLETLHEKHANTIAAYWHELDATLAPLELSSPDVVWTEQELQRLLLDFMKSPAALHLEDLVSDLDVLINDVEQAGRAADLDLMKAQHIKESVTVASLIVSIVLAIAVSIYLTQHITQPLMAVTHVAQQATAEANFELNAPITTQDEVGVLGTSLNHLIRKVKTLLEEQAIAQQQLEAYSQTLERKVAERTEELHAKNAVLQTTLQDLKKAQVAMIQSEKMSSLGQMVAGVAHEINNPVNFIHGNLTPAQDYAQGLLRLVHHYQQAYPNPPEAIAEEIEAIDLAFLQDDLPKLLASMTIGTERIRDIVKSLRTFSRLDEAELKVVDIHEGIESTLMILQNRIKPKPPFPGVHIQQEYGKLPPVECYPGQLNQVLMHLMVNAVDALEEWWRQAPRQDLPMMQICTRQLDLHSIRIRIRDNGPGIPQDLQKQLFDPFFTTKPVGQGTGLGLAISHQIITEQHHGTLECFSSPDISPEKGAEFVVTLPIRHHAEGEVSEEMNPIVESGYTERLEAELGFGQGPSSCMLKH